jgi:hypothetical protein
MERAVNAIRDKMGFTEVLENVQCTKNNTESNCHDFIQRRHFFSENRRGEKWVRCTKCYKWHHEECAGKREDWTQFIFSDSLDIYTDLYISFKCLLSV